MQEKRVFTEKSSIVLTLVITLVFGSVCGGFFYYFASLESSFNYGKHPTVYIIISIFFIPFVLVLLVSFSAKIKKVTCDSSSCEVASKRIWQRSWSLIDSFLWRDVTETKHVIIGFKPPQYIFTVIVNGAEKQLLNHYASSGEDFENLLAFAGRATPQLPYEWVRHDEIGNFQVLQDGYFTKVTRN